MCKYQPLPSAKEHVYQALSRYLKFYSSYRCKDGQIDFRNSISLDILIIFIYIKLYIRCQPLTVRWTKLLYFVGTCPINKINDVMKLIILLINFINVFIQIYGSNTRFKRYDYRKVRLQILIFCVQLNIKYTGNLGCTKWTKHFILQL